MPDLTTLEIMKDMNASSRLNAEATRDLISVVRDMLAKVRELEERVSALEGRSGR